MDNQAGNYFVEVCAVQESLGSTVHALCTHLNEIHETQLGEPVSQFGVFQHAVQEILWYKDLALLTHAFDA